ncbi:hypothetical protein niasHT_016573 [Heterodera trifolii]|uniref:Calpain catalytic domain-containing protein n=1 Tax=Heterodera trifolii TaxID=157864 RepID=A0ABD2LBB1_9BILA
MGLSFIDVGGNDNILGNVEALIPVPVGTPPASFAPLRDRCLEQMQNNETRLFEDSEFPVEEISLHFSRGVVPVRTLRIPNFPAPPLINQCPMAVDVRQGSLGNCWAMAAAPVLAKDGFVTRQAFMSYLVNEHMGQGTFETYQQLYEQRIGELLRHMELHGDGDQVAKITINGNNNTAFTFHELPSLFTNQQLICLLHLKMGGPANEIIVYNKSTGDLLDRMQAKQTAFTYLRKMIYRKRIVYDVGGDPTKTKPRRQNKFTEKPGLAVKSVFKAELANSSKKLSKKLLSRQTIGDGLSFQETIAKLEMQFAKPQSIFVDRFACLMATKEDGEEFQQFVNRHKPLLKDFQFDKMKKEQFKGLMFLTALKRQKTY